MCRKGFGAGGAAITTILLSVVTALTLTGEPAASPQVKQVPPALEAKVHDCEIHGVDIERLHWPCDPEVVISGYENGRDRRFHALRDGRAYFAEDLWRSDEGWSIANSESCADM